MKNGDYFLRFVIELACLHPEIEVVLLGSKNAGGEICECTGGRVGPVKVDEYFPISLDICNQIAACGVGFILAGWVPEADEECAVIFLVDIELIMISTEFEG